MRLVLISTSLFIISSMALVKASENPQETQPPKIIQPNILKGDETSFSKQEELLRRNFYLHKLGIDAPLTGTEKAESMLRQFLGKLTSYVNETDFDSVGFEAKQGMLKEDLFNIEKLVAKTQLPTLFNSRLELAKTIYLAMYEASEILNFYVHMNSLEKDILCEVIRLNVRLFVLKDSYGDAEFKAPDYCRRLYQFIGILKTWEGQFKRISEVPLVIKFMFRKQLSQAKTTIRDFAKVCESNL